MQPFTDSTSDETITTSNATNLQDVGVMLSRRQKTAKNVRSASSHMHQTRYRQLILTALAAVSCSAARAADFTIVNGSNVPLQQLYVSPCGAGQWGPNQLAGALPPSRGFTVSNIVPGCYDIQFVVAPWNNCVIAGASLRRHAVWKVTQWTVFGSQSGDCSHVANYVSAARQPWIWQPASSSGMRRE
ncbi:hypothetical protein JQ633_13425 [Bradyrhizobium tropiciagri]|uniref:hypothetical protein n=1 Tax=Bradyrhizobium tropiciagri TaxID=312253 RepID=UPI001BA945A0|nr:hypothetical protein [Bradyrhizobium tropiciagri]MBR0871363.1 hypothetical protein [Bradyrhizobium tropiciagri]